MIQNPYTNMSVACGSETGTWFQMIFSFDEIRVLIPRLIISENTVFFFTF